jgi:hypothetical protein
VKSSDLYRVLKRALGPSLKELGFSAAKGGSGLWVLPLDGQWLFLCFTGNKWGWSEPFGSYFHVDVILSRVSDYKAPENRGVARSNHPGRTTILEFFDEKSIADYCAIRNAAIDKGLNRRPKDLVGLMGDVAGREGKALEKEEPPLPFFSTEFPWVDEADIEAWAQFFAVQASRMPSRMRELVQQSAQDRRKHVHECWKRSDRRSEAEIADHRAREKAALAASIAATNQIGAALESARKKT